jgi:DNA modification methylase
VLKPDWEDKEFGVALYCGDCLEVLRTLPEQSVHCCVTSPPYYGLRDYGCDGQIGLEQTLDDYVAKMVEVFREVRRVLRDDGTLWLNLGDSYAGGGNNRGNNSPISNKQGSNAGVVGQCSGHIKNTHPSAIGMKQKDLIGIPWRVAFALQADGWYLRQDIIWAKPNPMPESVTDRCTKAHEYIFLLSKKPRYYYDNEAVKEPLAKSSYARLAQDIDSQQRSARVQGKSNGNMKAVGPRFGGNKYGDDKSQYTRTKSGNEWAGMTGMRNRRSVWTVTTQPFKDDHFAVFPPKLILPCILAGCPVGGTVLDPFGGSGTTAEVAAKRGRRAVLIELNPGHLNMQVTRVMNATRQTTLFGGVQ